MAKAKITKKTKVGSGKQKLSRNFMIGLITVVLVLTLGLGAYWYKNRDSATKLALPGANAERFNFTALGYDIYACRYNWATSPTVYVAFTTHNPGLMEYIRAKVEGGSPERQETAYKNGRVGVDHLQFWQEPGQKGIAVLRLSVHNNVVLKAETPYGNVGVPLAGLTNCK